METNELEIRHPIPTQANAKTILFALLHSARQVQQEFPEAFGPEAASELYDILIQVGKRNARKSR